MNILFTQQHLIGWAHNTSIDLSVNHTRTCFFSINISNLLDDQQLAVYYHKYLFEIGTTILMVNCAISGYVSLGGCLRNRMERIRQLLRFINF